MAVRKEEVKKLNRKLMDFLDHSVNAFFAVENMREILLKEGFHPLYEGEDWKLESGEKYFVTRNDSALIAFVLPKKPIKGFQMMASHSDSPVFKVKTDPEIEVDKAYIQLNVEKYGGMICSPWLDRPLSVAGRVLLRTAKGVETRLLNIDRDLLIIPNLAIHMNREVNDGYKFNAQKDMLPLFSTEEGKGGFRKIVAEALSVKEECILIGISSFITGRKPLFWARKKNLSEVEDWMICSVPLRPSRVFFRQSRRTVLPCIVSMTMKRWEAERSRERDRPS